MKKTFLIILILLSVSVIIFLAINAQQGSGSSYSLHYASGPAICEAPTHAALEKGFFSEEGIEVDVKIFPDGKTALSSLFEGEVQLAGVMATPVVKESFRRNDFRVIAVVEHPKFHHLLVNVNQITGPKDFAGKRIGVTRGTSGAYFMHAYSRTNKLNPADLHIFNFTGEEMVTAMSNREIDAMFSWNPYTSEVKKQMGRQVEYLDNHQMIQPSWIIVGKTQFILDNPEVIENFLRGLKKGVGFANKYPEELIAIHARISEQDKSYLEASTIRGKFLLSLPQELLLDMENQAHWLISASDSLTADLPVYLDLIYTDAMRNVSPETVTLIK